MIVTEKTIKRVPPLGGITKLSELEIDVDKDWGGYKIKNLGAPVDAGDAVRKTDLDSHRTASPVDHPDYSITRSKLEYPTVDVSFTYLSAIDKLTLGLGNTPGWAGLLIATADVLVDRAVRANVSGYRCTVAGLRFVDAWNHYVLIQDCSITASDNVLGKNVNGVWTYVAWEAVDLSDQLTYIYMFSISGSTIKSFRENLTTPKFTTTDTSLASGKVATGISWYYQATTTFIASRILSSASPSPSAVAVLEVNLEGSGKPEDPYRPSLSRNLAEVSSLTGLPDFLYVEAKKYNILISKGFTEDEMRLVFGYVPQHQVDLNAVSMGTFEFHPDKAPTVIVTVFSDNPYQAGAIDRQKGKAKRVFSVPKDYSEAVTLYKRLVKDYPHWLAGKDNFVYQVLGLEVFDHFQNVDFYYGELLEHKTHYNQLKQVNPKEVENRLNELISKLSTVTVLTEERDKHISKAKEVLKKGW